MPPLIKFLMLSTPQALLGPHLLILMKVTFYDLMIIFPFLVGSIYAQFSWQNSLLLFLLWCYVL